MILRKSEDILPIILLLMSIFVVCRYEIYTLQILSNHPTDYFVGFILRQHGWTAPYIDLCVRVFFIINLLYLSYLYYKSHNQNTISMIMLFFISNIYYLGIVITRVAPPAPIFWPLILMTFMLWHIFFNQKHKTLSSIFSCLLYAGIALINPFFALCLLPGFIMSKLVLQVLDPKKNYFYVMLIMVLCGFCSATVNLLFTGQLMDFWSKISLFYEMPLILSLIFALNLWYNLSSYDPQKEQSHTPKRQLLLYSCIMFCGMAIIGRLDFIAHL